MVTKIIEPTVEKNILTPLVNALSLHIKINPTGKNTNNNISMNKSD